MNAGGRELIVGIVIGLCIARPKEEKRAPACGAAAQGPDHIGARRYVHDQTRNAAVEPGHREALLPAHAGPHHHHRRAVPFRTAEETWFWFIKANQARLDGARYKSAEGSVPRPPGPGPIDGVDDDDPTGVGGESAGASAGNPSWWRPC